MHDSDRKFQDIREIPAYGIREAAHYLLIPEATLRSWVLGQAYRVGSERRRFLPPIRIAHSGKRLLSFLNLVEVHVLDGLRREHLVSLQKVRTALNFLGRENNSTHPLADFRFASGGLDLFIERYGELMSVSNEGQLAMKHVLEAYLLRVDRDPGGFVTRLYPFTRKRELDEPKAVVIDPKVSFGRPVLVGTGIPTAVIAERYKAGESVEDLAHDYERSRLEIEEAIRCELQAA